MDLIVPFISLNHQAVNILVLTENSISASAASIFCDNSLSPNIATKSKSCINLCLFSDNKCRTPSTNTEDFYLTGACVCSDQSGIPYYRRCSRLILIIKVRCAIVS